MAPRLMASCRSASPKAFPGSLKSEINVKEQIRQKAQKMLRENVVDPATTAIEGVLGGALDGLLDGIGLGTKHSHSEADRKQPEDSL